MKRFLKDVVTGKDKSMQGALLKPVLLILSLLFSGVIGSVRFLYACGFLPSYRPKKPVISVGNITVGGVGKTPIVMLIAQHLQKKGQCPVVLTRGYMPSGASGVAASDEAMMLRESLGVVVMVGADRVAAVKNAQDLASADIFILDDGFQQWRLQRDLDIVAIDATDPFGNGFVLPRGLLREPLGALARADVFVLTRTDAGRANVPAIRRELQSIKPGCLVIETLHAPSALEDVFSRSTAVDISLLQGRLVAVCGIGSPHSFASLLSGEGADVVRMFEFDDHHPYVEEDVRMVVDFCRAQKVTRVVTTHKDAVKLRYFEQAFQGVSLLVLKVEIKVVHGEAEFFSRIDRLRHP